MKSMAKLYDVCMSVHTVMPIPHAFVRRINVIPGNWAG